MKIDTVGRGETRDLCDVDIGTVFTFVDDDAAPDEENGLFVMGCDEEDSGEFFFTNLSSGKVYKFTDTRDELKVVVKESARLVL